MTRASGPRPAPAPVVAHVQALADFAAERYGAAPFLLRHTGAGWEAMSFTEAARAVHAFAALLAREGVRSGDRVALQGENRPEWGLAYLAILEAGGVVVPLDPQLREHEMGEILSAAGARHAVADGRHIALLEQARSGRVPGLRLVTLDADDEGLPSWPEAQRTFAGARARPPDGDPGSLAVLLFTSGTTGHPKGVMLSHANLLHNVEAVEASFAFDPGDRFLSLLPLHHTFEATAGFLCPLRIGASVAVARGLKSGTLREDLTSSGATIMLGVPLLYEKLLAALRRGLDEAPPARRRTVAFLLGVVRLARRATGLRVGTVLLRALRERSGLVRVRMFVSGASALPADVFWGFVDFGWNVVEGYGLTECSPVVAANRPDDTRPGTVGPPLEGVEVRIEAPDANGDGEVVVRGPNVMLGYFGDPEATAEVLQAGAFHTGDLGRLDPDGRLRITGRLKNMIATAAGKKIYPEEVEAVLGASPYVREVVVAAGREADGDREEVHAHVVPDLEAIDAHAASEGKTRDAAYVEALLRQEVDARGRLLAPYKRVKKVIVRDAEFPRTASGKIRRQDLRPD